MGGKSTTRSSLGNLKLIPITTEDDGDEHTRREKDGLDTVEESDVLATVSVETFPGGLGDCSQMMTRLWFDVL